MGFVPVEVRSEDLLKWVGRREVRRKERKEWPIENSSVLRWYALVVQPQKEFVAQDILHDKGVITFVPVERRWRKRNKYSKTKELISYAMAPRYVFVGFREGEVLWFDLSRVHLVTGVVGIDGEPVEIPQEAMMWMVGKYGNGLNAPDIQRYMRTRREFKEGERVVVTEGPFSGHKVNVKEIVRNKARLVFELFGTSRDVDIPLDILEPV